MLFFFFPRQLKKELQDIVIDLITNYNPMDDDKRNLQDAWDYVQNQVSPGGSTRQAMLLVSGLLDGAEAGLV